MISVSQNRSRRGVVLIVSWVFALGTATIVPAQSPSAPKEKETRTGERIAAEVRGAEEESLEVRYARAHLELAKLDLERAKAWNKRIPNVFSDRTIDFLQKHVEIDEEQLKQAMRPDYADVHEIYVRTAKAALDIAEADVARKAKSYKKEHDRQSGLELDRAMAFANAARLNLERTLNQGGSLQSISYLQWQLEELRNQILELHVKVEAASRR